MTGGANRKRYAVGAVTALAVLCVLALCWIFFAETADHDCSGKDCPVCAHLTEIRARIRTMTAAAGAAAVCLCLSVMAGMPDDEAPVCGILPVRNKVRLNI